MGPNPLTGAQTIQGSSLIWTSTVRPYEPYASIFPTNPWPCFQRPGAICLPYTDSLGAAGFCGSWRSHSKSNLEFLRSCRCCSSSESSGVSSTKEPSSRPLVRDVVMANSDLTLIRLAMDLSVVDLSWVLDVELPVGYWLLLPLVVPNILGAMVAHSDRTAGIHAQMMPTLVSTVLQTPTGTKSWVTFVVLAKTSSHCRRRIDTIVTLFSLVSHI